VKLATVFGVVARLGTPVAIRSATGRMTGGYAVYDLELELEDATIDLDHDAEKLPGRSSMPRSLPRTNSLLSA
jgi:hypothetical protein